jgi:hypothetical protein
MSKHWFWGHHVHEWDKWRLTEEGDYCVLGRRVGKYIVQKRECSECGLTEISRERLTV